MEESSGRAGALGVIVDAAVVIEKGKIKDILKKYTGSEGVDVKGAVVTPGLVDAHTHLVHGGFRTNEFVARMQGASYLEIAKQGGGIASTVAATRKASLDQLCREAKNRMDEAFAMGTTTMEIKTGYGLDVATELKMLEVIRFLRKNHPMKIVATFLGAHAFPPELKKNRKEYVRLIVEEMLPQAADTGLVQFCDVFVEESAFTHEEAAVILEAASHFGLKARLHVDQITAGGGAEFAVSASAVSAEHLDCISDRGIRALAKEKVSAVLLPGASFFVRGHKPLRGRFPPARKLIDAGVNVALATDYNPGTNPCLNLFLMGTIGATQMGMTLDEVWKGITINAAKSLLLEKECGTIAPGKWGDLLILDADNEYFPFYRYGKNIVKGVVKQGSLHWNP